MSRAISNSRKIRERLLAHRSALLARYGNENQLADELGSHPTEVIDVASEQWDARVLSLMSEADAHALGNVVGAIQRLDAGSYGICTACGERIAPARLDALPEAAECADCATSAEERVPRWVSSIGEG
jgi:DnaK suppressor protein